MSVILGFFPTIKSGVESNFLNEANLVFQEAPKHTKTDPKTGLKTTYRQYQSGELLSHKFRERNNGEDTCFFE